MEKYSYHDIDLRGRIERVEYATCDREGNEIQKYANVYLPCGYDPEKRYNVLYMMHGGGGNADAFIDSCPVKNMLDYSIANGRCEPLIVVFPSYYKRLRRELRRPGSPEERDETLFFQQELINDLIPAVEGKYSTFAEETTPEEIRASRMHRAFGGFSMGGCTTWYALLENLDSIGWFMPLSGDCWVHDIKGGQTKAKETALTIKDHIAASGYAPSEYRIFAATGTEDIAYDALTAQIEEMKKYPDVFPAQSLRYLLAEGEYHSYEAVYQYIWQFLPDLFSC